MRHLSVLILASTLGLACLAAEKAAERPTERVLYVCSARSILGKRFSATGSDKVLAQEEAMQRCESYAFRCYRTGCDVTGLR